MATKLIDHRRAKGIPTDSRVGELVRCFRTQQKTECGYRRQYSYREFADLLNERLPEDMQVSYASIERWEKGKCHPRPSVVNALLKVYVTPESKHKHQDWRYLFAKGIDALIFRVDKNLSARFLKYVEQMHQREKSAKV